MSRYRDLENEAEDRIRDNAPVEGRLYEVSPPQGAPAYERPALWRVLHVSQPGWGGGITYTDGGKNGGGFRNEYAISLAGWDMLATQGRIRRAPNAQD